MRDCHSDGRNLTKWLNLLSIFLDVYELRRNWGSKTNIQQKKISQYPAPLISHLLITQVGLQVLSNRIERLVTVDVDPSYRKSICKTLRKYSASNYERKLEILSHRLDSTRIERLVTVDVDPSQRKSICKILRKYSASGYKRGLQIFSNRTNTLI